MNLWEAVALGLVQGVSEFLPISSSGHLVLAQSLMGVNAEGVELEVTVHLATLVAILFFYRRTLAGLCRGLAGRGGDGRTRRESLRYVGLLALGSVPAGAAGLLCRSWFHEAFESPRLAAALLAVTGLFLLSTRLAPGRKDRALTWGRALAVGAAQALAILPGVSRSGSTVGTGLWTGVRGAEAAEFSFLLAVPAIAGAGALTFAGAEAFRVEAAPLAAAFAASLASGYASLVLLVRVLERERLHWFGPYCLLAGAAAFTWLSL